MLKYHPLTTKKQEMTEDNKMNQIEMLQYIKVGHKYKGKKSSFTFVPMEVTLRDPEGNYMGTAFYAVIHLIGAFSSRFRIP